ncbi:MAG: ABC transporter substrate-binding protein, partial [Myxococcota bacterium]
VEAFNAANQGKIEVEWRQMDRQNDRHRAALVKDLSSKTSTIDLLASDVVWTAELAKNKWVEDLTPRFESEYNRKAILAPALESATYRLRVWGVPWYTDAGMLFYRKDRLRESGVGAAPKTWDELAKISLRVMKDTGTRYGFVFQGAEYEGGAANAAEYVWSAGGDVMTGRVTVTGLVVSRVTETDIIAINSKEAAQGFDIARKLVVDQVAPADVANFKEKDALDAFVAGDAVFLRSWPYAYRILRDAGFTAEQIGIAPLPSASGVSASCLGGWNLMINARSTDAKREAAWTLIRFLTDRAQQERQAREASLLPIRVELYGDSKLANDVPVMALGRQVFEKSLRSRPKSPFYAEVSSRIARAFNRTLKGELTGEQAVKALERELRAIAIRN